MNPIFQAILRPYMPPEPKPTPPSPSPEAIDAAMLADKLADGYNLRKIDNAINLELKYAKPEN